MNKATSQLTSANILVLAHVFFVSVYGWSVVTNHPLAFLFYCLSAYFVLRFILNTKLPLFFAAPSGRDAILIAKAIACAFVIFFITKISELQAPNLLMTSYAERTDAAPLLNRFLFSMVFVSCMLLGTSEKPSEKTFSSIVLVLLYFSSGSTSRGGLLLYFVLLFAIWSEYKLAKIIFSVSLLLLTALFVYILQSRLGLDSVDLQTIFELESQSSVESHFTRDDLQPNKINLLIFFIPAIIKGEWIATNQFISEELLGISWQNPFFYIITLGDFAVYKMGYGDFWFLYFLFGFSMSVFLLRLSIGCLPQYKYYYYLIFILIGSRAGTESLLSQILHGTILPLLILIFLRNLLYQTKIYRRKTCNYNNYPQ